MVAWFFLVGPGAIIVLATIPSHFAARPNSTDRDLSGTEGRAGGERRDLIAYACAIAAMAPGTNIGVRPMSAWDLGCVETLCRKCRSVAVLVGWRWELAQRAILKCLAHVRQHRTKYSGYLLTF